ELIPRPAKDGVIATATVDEFRENHNVIDICCANIIVAAAADDCVDALDGTAHRLDARIIRIRRPQPGVDIEALGESRTIQYRVVDQRCTQRTGNRAARLKDETVLNRSRK